MKVRNDFLPTWICQDFEYAGINTKMFNSHSVWAASTSEDNTVGKFMANFFKSVNGPKNQRGKYSIIKRYFQKQLLLRFW